MAAYLNVVFNMYGQSYTSNHDKNEFPFRMCSKATNDDGCKITRTRKKKKSSSAIEVGNR